MTGWRVVAACPNFDQVQKEGVLYCTVLFIKWLIPRRNQGEKKSFKSVKTSVIFKYKVVAQLCQYLNC